MGSVRDALLNTASALETLTPSLRSDMLQRACALAMLRRACLQDAWPDLADAVEAWRLAEDRGCPLLDPDLDSRRGPEARRAYELAVLPDSPSDLGSMHLALRDLRLLRRSKGAGFRVEERRESNRRAGAFYTPLWMARRLSEMLLPEAWRPDALLDPACGDGRLLAACLERLAGSGGPADPEEIRARIAGGLRGVEVDALTAALARCRLWLLAAPERGPVEGLDKCIQCADAIADPLAPSRGRGKLNWRRPGWWPGQGGFDAVVANPPFEVLTGFAKRPGLERYVRRIRSAGYELSVAGTLNTYRLFLERCLQVLRPGGRLAIVLPVGFLMDRSAADLRRRMLEEGWLEEVELHPESHRAFESVGQATILLGARLTRRRHGQLRIRPAGREGGEHSLDLAAIRTLEPENMPLPVGAAASVRLAYRMRALNESSFGQVFTGRVGEVDQTLYRDCMLDCRGEALLLRGAHLSPFRADLSTGRAKERWLDLELFSGRRGGGAWRKDSQQARVVQTGIVNMEAQRRLVAAQVPAGVFLGNSVNYWVASKELFDDASLGRAYGLGLLNSAPMEWRFRLTSSNNNVNLYEIRELPLPRLRERMPAQRAHSFHSRCRELLRDSRLSPLDTVLQISSGWGSPSRDDRAVCGAIAEAARALEMGGTPARMAWLQAALDYLVTWHLGLEEQDLEYMLECMPARAGHGADEGVE